jgi:hypothetical protein
MSSRKQLNTDIQLQILAQLSMNNVLLMAIADKSIDRATRDSFGDAQDYFSSINNKLVEQSKVLDKKEQE